MTSECLSRFHNGRTKICSGEVVFIRAQIGALLRVPARTDKKRARRLERSRPSVWSSRDMGGLGVKAAGSVNQRKSRYLVPAARGCPCSVIERWRAASSVTPARPAGTLLVSLPALFGASRLASFGGRLPWYWPIHRADPSRTQALLRAGAARLGGGRRTLGGGRRTIDICET
jgi:hypothetical protein